MKLAGCKTALNPLAFKNMWYLQNGHIKYFTQFNLFVCEVSQKLGFKVSYETGSVSDVKESPQLNETYLG